MNCNSCNAELVPGAAFCTACGAQVVAGDPYGPGSDVPVAASRPPAGLVAGAVICAVIALVFLPPVMGGIAIYLGSRVRKYDESLGTNLMIGAGIAMVAGIVIGVLVWTSA